jgi:hypothetical protein
MAKQVADQITSHPDKDEIITKLISEISEEDIADWLKAKYNGQKQLLITKKNLTIFKDEYLDFYSTIREDLLKTQFNLAVEPEDAMEEIKGNEAYKKKLLDIADKELDIKTVIKRLVISIEHRAEQVFDHIQRDPRNIKMDRTLIEWFTLLLNTLEKFDLVTNGNPEQVTIQNNISIQLVDSHINMVYGVIREILAQLDYETSLLFTELFTKRLSELKASEESVIPMDKRLDAAYEIEGKIKDKLDI